MGQFQTRVREHIKPFVLNSDKPSGPALVKCYTPLLESAGPTKAAMWLHGLETILEQARAFDSDLDARLQTIFAPRTVQVKPTASVPWIDSEMQPEKPRPSMVWRYGKPTTTRVRCGRKAG